MNQDIILSLVLFAWFVSLAILEHATKRDSQPAASSDADARFVTNYGFTAILLIAGATLPLANAGAAASGEGLQIGLANHVHIPWLALFALMLTAQTFTGYWTHRWLHHYPILWRIHRVHHADTAVDVSTSLRNHPFEVFLTLPVSVAITLTIGAPISVVTAGQTIIVAATIWEHADISLPPRIDRALSAVILTPRLHRLHHSSERAIHDSNFGTVFSFWDRMFGTLSDLEGRQEVGLDGQVARPDHFLAQMWAPLQPA